LFHEALQSALADLVGNASVLRSLLALSSGEEYFPSVPAIASRLFQHQPKGNLRALDRPIQIQVDYFSPFLNIHLGDTGGRGPCSIQD
jgi:hypothetical protein